ncbi:1-deoxy-D-xylulose-5-phosphate reductoisomerase [Hydrogenophaga sp.]|uniref:1-deoxy-D-xylulose-5-phosphate reductoisomerase n=1 Tax=Hydrogenophaga sp. TaxID=1904254 RepID=UPI002731422D|nr:1-deoxy-D-xylulose-5-phosphate reductoisomerase [Hydrogenophaga sp.]MDP1687341.1 1-deoxy-D-xylulose-5-phosphate reductoisomerase [Hydrogenophaga sp.]
MHNPAPYPYSRPRRLRRDPFTRDLVREHRLTPADLIYPVFVLDGAGRREAVVSMPGVERLSLDLLLPVAEDCVALGIPVMALFPVIDQALKTPDGQEALNPDGLVPRVVRELKKRFPQLGVMTDVALDPYTSHGQDGLLDEHNYILNDPTVEILVKQAVTQAQAPACVVNGLVGAAGLAPTLAAAERGLRIALANKEALVVGGQLVAAAVARGGAELLPVDSEHAAIAQCLSGREPSEVARLVLTASGGPFRTTPAADLGQVTLEQVLAHPTWRMGPKITVDSATLMNKGLEVIEAHHLFGLPYGKIDVVVHPGSIVHSLVEFVDGALLAQLGTPDMRVPLQYAIAGEIHWPLDGGRLDLLRAGPLVFEAPDTGRFPCLRLARQAGQAGGTAPVVLNAANEVAVAALLAGRLRFADIPGVIADTLARLPHGPVPDLAAALDADARARTEAAVLVDARGAGGH